MGSVHAIGTFITLFSVTYMCDDLSLHYVGEYWIPKLHIIHFIHRYRKKLCHLISVVFSSHQSGSPEIKEISAIKK